MWGLRYDFRYGYHRGKGTAIECAKDDDIQHGNDEMKMGHLIYCHFCNDFPLSEDCSKVNPWQCPWPGIMV